MTAKRSPTKPPSMLAILQLIRKTQLAQDRRLAAVENALHLVRLDVGHGAKQRETIETLARHAERLLREKEIVMAAVDVDDLRRKVQEAAKYMSAPMEEPVFAGSTPMPPAMAIGGEPTREYVWDEANVAAAANSALQAPDLRAANGHERIPTLRPARRPAYELCGFVATHRAGVRCGVCEWTG